MIIHLFRSWDHMWPKNWRLLAFCQSGGGEAIIFIRVECKSSERLLSSCRQDVDVKCLPVEDDETLIVCDDIGNPLQQTSSVTFTLTLNNRISSSDKQLNITTWVNTWVFSQQVYVFLLMFSFCILLFFCMSGFACTVFACLFKCFF